MRNETCFGIYLVWALGSWGFELNLRTVFKMLEYCLFFENCLIHFGGFFFFGVEDRTLDYFYPSKNFNHKHGRKLHEIHPMGNGASIALIIIIIIIYRDDQKPVY